MTNETENKLFAYLSQDFNILPLQSDMQEIEHIIQSGTYLEKLTDLQTKIGYVAGDIHPVAMLGLLGEAGEVSECTHFMSLLDEPTAIQSIKCNYEAHAATLDAHKKKIRRLDKPAYEISVAQSFDIELADLFYYIKAIAANRGLTIEDLARMSYEKVIARRGQVKEGDPAK